jgi:hypothetical protein
MCNSPAAKMVERAKIARWKHSDEPKIQEILLLFLPVTVS